MGKVAAKPPEGCDWLFRRAINGCSQMLFSYIFPLLGAEAVSNYYFHAPIPLRGGFPVLGMELGGVVVLLFKLIF